MPLSTGSLPSVFEALKSISSNAKTRIGLRHTVGHDDIVLLTEEMGFIDTVCTSSNLVDLQITLGHERMGTQVLIAWPLK